MMPPLLLYLHITLDVDADAYAYCRLMHAGAAILLMPLLYDDTIIDAIAARYY